MLPYAVVSSTRTWSYWKCCNGVRTKDISVKQPLLVSAFLLRAQLPPNFASTSEFIHLLFSLSIFAQFPICKNLFCPLTIVVATMCVLCVSFECFVIFWMYGCRFLWLWSLYSNPDVKTRTVGASYRIASYCTIWYSILYEASTLLRAKPHTVTLYKLVH